MATAKRSMWAKKPVAVLKAKFAGKKSKATRKTIKSKRKPANAKIAGFNSSLQQALKNAKSSEQKRLVAERKLKALKAQFARKVKMLESKMKASDLKHKQAANRDSVIRAAANKIVAQFNKPKAASKKRRSVSKARKSSARRSTRHVVGRRKAA